MRVQLIAAMTLWIACAQALAQAYRWVDEEGKVHYTQNPPPPGAKGVQRKNFRNGAVGTVDLPYATQEAAKNFPVTLYTMPECSPCDQARASLVKRSIPFREVSVTAQKDADEMKKLTGTSDVPVLVVGSQFRAGFQENLYNDLLDTAGYAPSGPKVPMEKLRKMDPAPAKAQQGASGGDQPGAAAK